MCINWDHLQNQDKMISETCLEAGFQVLKIHNSGVTLFIVWLRGFFPQKMKQGWWFVLHCMWITKYKLIKYWIFRSQMKNWMELNCVDLSVSQYFPVLWTLFCLSKHCSQCALPVRMNGYHVLGVARWFMPASGVFCVDVSQDNPHMTPGWIFPLSLVFPRSDAFWRVGLVFFVALHNSLCVPDFLLAFVECILRLFVQYSWSFNFRNFDIFRNIEMPFQEDSFGFFNC